MNTHLAPSATNTMASGRANILLRRIYLLVSFTSLPQPNSDSSDIAHTIEGFHGSRIPVNGTAVVGLIHRRLTMARPWEA